MLTRNSIYSALLDAEYLQYSRASIGVNTFFPCKQYKKKTISADRQIHEICSDSSFQQYLIQHTKISPNPKVAKSPTSPQCSYGKL
jgi:glutathione peroxidase-family protein